MKKSLSVGDKIFLENSQENGPKEKKREKRGDRKKIWAEVQESIQKEEPNDSPEVPRQEEGQQCTSPGLPSGVTVRPPEGGLLNALPTHASSHTITHTIKR